MLHWAGGDSGSPERLDAGPVVLRRQRVEDAAAIAAAVAASLDHLRPWMPWATPDQADPEVQRRRLESETGSWEAGGDHTYLVVDPAGTEVLGAVGLHRRVGPGGLEIGYWLRHSATGRGWMTAAVAAATAAALDLAGIDRVEIHCDVANERSAAIPRRLGYLLDRIEDDGVEAPGETGRSMVWVMDARRWAATGPAQPGGLSRPSGSSSSSQAGA